MNNLMRYYKSAQSNVYGAQAYVLENQVDKFSALEVELMEHHISPEHYAIAQAVLWRDWVKKRGLSHLPANVFLGDVSRQRYNRLLDQPTVEPVMSETSRARALGLVVEKQFLTYYMERVLYNNDTVDEDYHLRTFTDNYQNEASLFAWADYCELYGHRSDLIREVINYCTAYWKLTGLSYSYHDLAGAYVKTLRYTKDKLTKRLYELNSKRYPELVRTVSNMLMVVEQELESLRYGS